MRWSTNICENRVYLNLVTLVINAWPLNGKKTVKISAKYLESNKILKRPTNNEIII
ncbi:hypothetical protein GCM10007199_20440 [Fictibacillus barbaricus]|nr:hypothetical protein GCM10007199_20440 [Fictibacillus barbaricus]